MLRYLKSIVFRVYELKGEVIERHAVESELKRLDDGTGRFAIVIIRASIAESENYCGSVCMSLYHLILRVRQGDQ